MLEGFIFLLVVSIIMFVICVIVLIYNIKEMRVWMELGYCAISNKVGIIVASVLIILASIGIVYDSVAQATYEQMPVKERLLESTEIVQLRDTGFSVSGGFFLGSGSVNGQPAYLYYIKADGGYKLKSVRASSVTIRYIYDNSTPRIEYIRVEYYYTHYWLNEPRFLYSGSRQKIIIYVPEGSIRQYYLDPDVKLN